MITFTSATQVEENVILLINCHDNEKLQQVLSQYKNELSHDTIKLIEDQIKFNTEHANEATHLMAEAHRIQKAHDAKYYQQIRDRMGHFSNIEKDGLGRVTVDFFTHQRGRTNLITDLTKVYDANKKLLEEYKTEVNKQNELIARKNQELSEVNEGIEQTIVGLESVNDELLEQQEVINDFRQLVQDKRDEISQAQNVLSKYNANSSSDLYNPLNNLYNVQSSYNAATSAADQQSILSNAGLSTIDELTDKIEELEEAIGNLEDSGEMQGLQDSLASALENLNDETERMNELEQEKLDLIDQQNALYERQGALQDDIANAQEKVRDLNNASTNLAKENLAVQNKILQTVEKRNDVEERNNALMKSANGMFSGLGQIASGLFDIVKMGAEEWIEINDSAFRLGKTLGMNRQQAYAYQNSLLHNNYGLMMAYGKTNEELIKLQENYSNAINNVTLLNTKQMEGAVALGQFIGDENVMKTVSEFDKFGAGVDTATEYLAVTNERAKMYGLNAQKTSEAFANNIKMASRYTFKDGINGISRMTMLSERLRFNMQNLGAVIDKFSTVESSISTSAQMQLLGGSYAANFSNPLENMNMALTDGEAMMEKLVDTFKDKGSFDETTGMMKIGSFDKALMAQAASALGLSYEDVFNMANQQGKASDMDKRSGVDSRFTDQSQKDWIYNNAQWDAKQQKWYVNHFNDKGEQKRIDVDQLNASNIGKIRQTSTKEEMMQNDVHAMRVFFLGQTESRAQGTVSFKQDIEADKSVAKTKMAELANPVMTFMADALRALNVNKDIQNDVTQFGLKIVDKLKEIIKWLTSHAWIKYLLGGIGALLLASKVGLPVGKLFGGIGKAGKGLFGVTRNILGRFIGGGAAEEGATAAGRAAATKAVEEESARAAARSGSQIAKGGIGRTATAAGRAAATKAVEEESARAAARSGSQIAKGGIGRTATRAGIKMFGRNGARIAGKVLGGAGLAALLGGAMAMWETHENNNQYEDSVARINKRYGNFENDNLSGRLANGGASFDSQAEKAMAIQQADLKRKNNNKAAWASAAGGVVGGALGSLLGPIGSVIGGTLGTVAGRGIARLTESKVTENDVIGKKGLAQRYFEDTKIGMKNIKSKDQLFEQAAVATIGMHDLLISWHNEKNNLSREGLTEKEQKAKKKTLEQQKEAASGKKSQWWNPFSWWSTGGVVHAAEGDIINSAFAKTNRRGTDTVPSMLTPGEMVLNARQQSRLFNIVSGREGIYESPTRILEKNLNNSFSSTRSGKISIDPINININISGNGNLQGLDKNAIQQAILDPSTIRRIHEALDRVTSTMFNGGSASIEHSPHKLSHV